MKGLLWFALGLLGAFILYGEFIRWIERHAGNIQ
jgi:hypothetical protein